MKKKRIRSSFVQAGMINKETVYVPSFDALMSTCKRWVSSVKDITVPKAMKDACKAQFPKVIQKQIEEGQISYPDMKEVDIPFGKWSPMYIIITMQSQIF